MPVEAAKLSKDDVVAYVAQNAGRYGLDPAAVLAVADHEGLNTKPGSFWQLPGEWGKSFGPPSWYQGGAGGDIVKMQGSVENAANWSWTPAGIDYWLQSVAANGASGKQGIDAIVQIVGGWGWGFERPANSAKGIDLARQVYNDFQAKVAEVTGNSSGIPIPIPGLPRLPGQTQPGQLPIPANPQEKTAPSPSTSSGFSMHILDLPTGPVNLTLPWDISGILLFLAAIFMIIIGALLWDKTRTVIVKTSEVAAVAA